MCPSVSMIDIGIPSGESQPRASRSSTGSSSGLSVVVVVAGGRVVVVEVELLVVVVPTKSAGPLVAMGPTHAADARDSTARMEVGFLEAKPARDLGSHLSRRAEETVVAGECIVSTLPPEVDVDLELGLGSTGSSKSPA